MLVGRSWPSARRSVLKMDSDESWMASSRRGCISVTWRSYGPCLRIAFFIISTRPSCAVSLSQS